MKPENAIEVKNVTKKFKVFLDKGYTLKELTLFSKRRKYEEREVLKGISFEVKKGEAIGLIGHNGCGKSTTLKLLTKIMYPDSGTIEMKGRVSSLIELGAGFHPDMSGRQNIYTNASIFGLTRKEIDQRMDDIIAFSELEEFIDNPIRTYSSGMYMRLAFSVAINVDADILLIDEILAVGDANFQAKCFEKLHEIKRNGTTIVIVSHSMGQIEQICDKSIWIHDGVIKKMGKPKEVDEEYLYTMEKKRVERQIEEQQKPQEEHKESEEPSEDNQEVKEFEDKWKKLRDKIPKFADQSAIRMGTGEVEFTDIKIMDGFGNEKNAFETGDSFIIKETYISHIKDGKANFGIGIFRDDGVHCYGTNIEIEQGEKASVKESGSVQINISKCNLLPGKYWLDIAVHGDSGYYFDDIRRVKSFNIISKKRDIWIARIDTSWKIH